MRTFKIVLAYDGYSFSGFARQASARTVQGDIEGALARIFAAEILTVGAGRTDAGVHALGQVLSFSAPGSTSAKDIFRRLKSMVPEDVSIRSLDVASESFDARRWAIARRYEYRILCADSVDPTRRRYMLHHPGKLDVDAMRKGAEQLIGTHDFSSFARVPEGARPLRTLDEIECTNSGEDLAIRVSAGSFLQQMVRSIVGTLLKVGEYKIDPPQVANILQAKSRAAAGPVAPPHGLFLMGVRYPEALA